MKQRKHKNQVGCGHKSLELEGKEDQAAKATFCHHSLGMSGEGLGEANIKVLRLRFDLKSTDVRRGVQR